MLESEYLNGRNQAPARYTNQTDGNDGLNKTQNGRNNIAAEKITAVFYHPPQTDYLPNRSQKVFEKMVTV